MYLSVTTRPKFQKIVYDYAKNLSYLCWQTVFNPKSGRKQPRKVGENDHDGRNRPNWLKPPIDLSRKKNFYSFFRPTIVGFKNHQNVS